MKSGDYRRYLANAFRNLENKNLIEYSRKNKLLVKNKAFYRDPDNCAFWKKIRTTIKLIKIAYQFFNIEQHYTISHSS